jgi:hypothetical protein
MYRVFAHKFKWSPQEVDNQPVTLLAALNHDFEAERVRLNAMRDDPEWEKRNKDRIVKVDERVPLHVRVMPVPAIDAWIRRWNKANPTQPPMAQPEVIPLSGTSEVQGKSL